MAEEMEEVKVPYRNSRLFSRDFIADRLPDSADWKISPEELKSVQARLRDLFARALPSTSEAGLEEEMKKLYFEALDKLELEGSE